MRANWILMAGTALAGLLAPTSKASAQWVEHSRNDLLEVLDTAGSKIFQHSNNSTYSRTTLTFSPDYGPWLAWTPSTRFYVNTFGNTTLAKFNDPSKTIDFVAEIVPPADFQVGPITKCGNRICAIYVRPGCKGWRVASWEFNGAAPYLGGEWHNNSNVCVRGVVDNPLDARGGFTIVLQNVGIPGWTWYLFIGNNGDYRGGRDFGNMSGIIQSVALNRTDPNSIFLLDTVDYASAVIRKWSLNGGQLGTTSYASNGFNTHGLAYWTERREVVLYAKNFNTNQYRLAGFDDNTLQLKNDRASTF